MSGRSVRLRPVLPQDTEFLYTLATAPETGFRWRFNGYVPSTTAFEATVWNDILVQFVGHGEAGQPLSHVLAYGASHTHGHVHFGVVTRPGAGKLVGIESSALLIDYLFATWNFNKLYADVAEFNLPQFKSIVGRYASIEGRLKGHLWYGGRSWDQVILAVYRDPTWQQIRQRLERFRERAVA
jgi:RimJ/RimL family protein N-acetyltransferase